MADTVYMTMYTTSLKESTNATENAMAKALEANDTEAFLKNRIKVNQKNDQTFSSFGYQLKNAIAFDTYLLKHHMKPLNINMSCDYNQLSAINGISVLYKATKWISMMIPLVSLLPMLMSLLRHNKAYHYMMSLPVRKTTLIKTKWLAGIAAGFTAVVLLFTGSFLLGFMIGGSGDFSYPIVLHTADIAVQEVSSYIPFWLFLFCVLAVILLQITAYVSLEALLCKVIRNVWGRYLLLFILAIIATYVPLTLPADLNVKLPLISLVCALPYAIVTQGYAWYSLLLYFALLIGISLWVYYRYMRKHAKGVYFDEI